MLGLMLVALGFYLIGTFSMLGDELVNFAQCCTGEMFPFPVIGSYTIWVSWMIQFGVTRFGELCIFLGPILFYRSRMR